MSSHDLVIRNGTIIDGSGSDRYSGDLAVTDGVITAVGQVVGRGRREVNADGRLVQPGFVDIHTHYDGQATWDPQLAPSSWHGVTTVVMGNCGVGFAPVKPADHERLIQLMEGVEDIPGTALHEGLPWAWQTFEEYLDFVDSLEHDIDVGAQLPHAAVRLAVMGERGAAREPASPDDIAEMADLARRAIQAGAVGFTSSRTLNHRSSLGEYTPTLNAEFDELVGIAEAIGTTGKGVLQLISDFVDFDAEFELARAMGARSGRPISISVGQAAGRPHQWRRMLDAMAEATADGVIMRGQVGARPVGILMGLHSTINPFMHCESYKAIRDLPLVTRVQQMRRDEVRSAILSENLVDADSPLIGSRLVSKWNLMYVLGDPPNYEPDPSSSIMAQASARGIDPASLAYDLLTEGDGTNLLYVPTINFVDGNLDCVREQILHPASVPGLSDGGAHVGTICDVSFPTTLMQWWGRDRPHGRIRLETIVHKQARATAQAVGFMDRGILAPGYKADINVIDFEALTLRSPTIVDDLPAGGKRFLQKVTGIDHTFVCGVEIASNSESTGATPGRLVRGATEQPNPPG